MKRLPRLLLLILLCLMVSCAAAETEGEFSYSVSGGEATVTAYTGSSAALTVPDTLGGCPVTAIGYCAFRECETLTHVTLPRGITAIGGSAFRDCFSLEQINLPDTLSVIGTHAFYGCPRLTQLTIPESIERFQGYPFYGCSAVRVCSLYGQAAHVLTGFGYSFSCPEYPLLALKAYDDTGMRTFTVAGCDKSAITVSLPDGVTAIARHAFSGCAALTEIVLPDGVSEIPDSAFEGCTALKKVTIPSSVKAIADSAFARCGDVTIIAPEGGAGQEAAERNGFSWRAL